MDAIEYFNLGYFSKGQYDPTKRFKFLESNIVKIYPVNGTRLVAELKDGSQVTLCETSFANYALGDVCTLMNMMIAHYKTVSELLDYHYQQQENDEE